MSQQKITIALIGEKDARAASKKIITGFSQQYIPQNQPNSVLTSTQNSDYVLENFLFEGCLVKIVEIELEDENPPQCDGAILPAIRESKPVIPEKKPWESPTLQRTLKQLDELKKTIPIEEQFIVKSARQVVPYQGLAEKIGAQGDRLIKIDLFKSDPSESKVTTQKQNFTIIENTLRELIRVDKFLKPFHSAYNINANLAETSPSPWYKKSKWLLLAIVLLLIISAGLFTAFALTGLLLTPFLAIPIIFLVSIVMISIKIGFDNRRPVSTIPDQQIGASTRQDTLTSSTQAAAQASKPLLSQPTVQKNMDAAIKDVFEELRTIFKKNHVELTLDEASCKKALQIVGTLLKAQNIDLNAIFTVELLYEYQKGFYFGFKRKETCSNEAFDLFKSAHGELRQILESIGVDVCYSISIDKISHFNLGNQADISTQKNPNLIFELGEVVFQPKFVRDFGVQKQRQELAIERVKIILTNHGISPDNFAIYTIDFFNFGCCVKFDVIPRLVNSLYKEDSEKVKIREGELEKAKTLFKKLLGNDINMDCIQIDRILNLPDELVNAPQPQFKTQ